MSNTILLILTATQVLISVLKTQGALPPTIAGLVGALDTAITAALQEDAVAKQVTNPSTLTPIPNV